MVKRGGFLMTSFRYVYTKNNQPRCTSWILMEELTLGEWQEFYDFLVKYERAENINIEYK